MELIIFYIIESKSYATKLYVYVPSPLWWDPSFGYTKFLVSEFGLQLVRGIIEFLLYPDECSLVPVAFYFISLLHYRRTRQERKPNYVSV